MKIKMPAGFVIDTYFDWGYKTDQDFALAELTKRLELQKKEKDLLEERDRLNLTITELQKKVKNLSDENTRLRQIITGLQMDNITLMGSATKK